MKTGDLIKGLSADKTPGMPMARTWLLATLAAVGLAALAFFALLGPRPDINDAMGSWRFLLKFVETGLLALTAWGAVTMLSSPGQYRSWPMVALLAAPVLLVIAAMLEMSLIPSGDRVPKMIGTNNMLCLLAIPAIGLPPLAVFLAALKHSAPVRPGVAGAVAGLFAGGIAAFFYGMHCIDDSPLFVIIWYTLAIAILAAIGAVAGRRILRW